MNIPFKHFSVKVNSDAVLCTFNKETFKGQLHSFTNII